MLIKTKLAIAIMAGVGATIIAGFLTLLFPVLILPWMIVKGLCLLVAIAEGVRIYHKALAPLIEQKKLKLPTSLSSFFETIHTLKQQEAAPAKQSIGLKQIFSISTVVISLVLAALLTIAPALIFTISIYSILSRIENLHFPCLHYFGRNHKDQHAISINKQPAPQEKPTEQTAEQSQKTTNNQSPAQDTATPQTSEEASCNKPELNNATPLPATADQTTTPPSGTPNTNTTTLTLQPLVASIAAAMQTA